MAGIELISISATLSDSVFVGLYGSLRVFADLSVVFPFGLSRFFTVFPRTVRPSATIWKQGFTLTGHITNYANY